MLIIVAYFLLQGVDQNSVPQINCLQFTILLCVFDFMDQSSQH